MTEAQLKKAGVDLDKLRASGQVQERLLKAVPVAEESPEDERLSEKQFQADVVKLARRRGWLVYHTYDSRKSAKGFPDLVMVKPGAVDGRLIFAELKSQSGKMTDEQNEWISALACCPPGVEVYLWRPSDWPKIEEVL